MTALLSGQVTITLDGGDVILLPTLDAAIRIARHFNGFQPAINRIAAMDLDAYVAVVLFGMGHRTQADAPGLDKKVFKTGMLALMTPLTEYLMVLANGGRSLTQEAEAEGEPGKTDAAD